VNRPVQQPQSGSAGLVERWREFWFQPQPAYPLGLVRIAFGALMVLWALSLLPDLFDFFGSDGVAAVRTTNDWGLFAFWSSDAALLIGWWMLLAAAFMLAIGWHSRVAALVIFVLIVSFERRTYFVFNAGDGLIRIEALLLMLSACGAALSLDRRRAGQPFWSAELRAPWVVRLMQVQLSLIYLTSVLVKATGDTWQQGTAVSYALRLDDMLILPVPQWLSNDALLMNVVTWGTLALELAIGVLIWNRRLRPWVLGAGVVMHMLIMLSINVGFFTPAMFVLYLAFVPPDRVSRFPHELRRVVIAIRLRRRDGVSQRRAAEVTSNPTTTNSDGESRTSFDLKTSGRSGP
jgi:Vitamin K-dependent gamma-carboxylase